MPPFAAPVRKGLDDLARRHDVSPGAVTALLEALIQGKRGMAQFDHPDLGGAGQWMRGGMTMVGDLSSPALKGKVDRLCSELSALLGQQLFLSPPDQAPEPGQQDNPARQSSPGAPAQERGG